MVKGIESFRVPRSKKRCQRLCHHKKQVRSQNKQTNNPIRKTYKNTHTKKTSRIRGKFTFPPFSNHKWWCVSKHRNRNMPRKTKSQNHRKQIYRISDWQIMRSSFTRAKNATRRTKQNRNGNNMHRLKSLLHTSRSKTAESHRSVDVLRKTSRHKKAIEK